MTLKIEDLFNGGLDHITLLLVEEKNLRSPYKVGVDRQVLENLWLTHAVDNLIGPENSYEIAILGFEGMNSRSDLHLLADIMTFHKNPKLSDFGVDVDKDDISNRSLSVKSLLKQSVYNEIMDYMSVEEKTGVHYELDVPRQNLEFLWDEYAADNMLSPEDTANILKSGFIGKNDRSDLTLLADILLNKEDLTLEEVMDPFPGARFIR